MKKATSDTRKQCSGFAWINNQTNSNMKLIRKPLNFIVPALVFGLVACGPSAEDVANLEAELNDMAGDMETALEEELTAPEATESMDFTSKDGHFSIQFPGEPQHASNSVPTDVGDIMMETYMYEKSATEVFMVAYNDYPSIYVDESNADELLEGGKSGALESLGIMTTEVEEKIEVDGHPGIFFTGNNGQYYVVYEVYLVNNRLYQIAILRDGSYPSDEDVANFTKTFKLNAMNDAPTAGTETEEAPTEG